MEKYTKRINDNFLKKLFSDNNYRKIKIGSLISRQLTYKTNKEELTDLITSNYNKITVPYRYNEIKHLSKLLIIFYRKINKLINGTHEFNDYEEIVSKSDDNFIVENDLVKLYNALYYCLMTTNINIYNIKKKGIGKKANYFVYKIIKDGKTIYILTSLINLEDSKFKFSLDVFRPPNTYNDVIELRDYIKKSINNNRESRTSSKTKSY